MKSRAVTRRTSRLGVETNCDEMSRAKRLSLHARCLSVQLSAEIAVQGHVKKSMYKPSCVEDAPGEAIIVEVVRVNLGRRM
eukprot:6162646-Pyramimonas_sp.AAC.1